MGTFKDAQPYVTGAVHFVIKPRGGDATYLGTSEFSPYFEIDKAYLPLYNDLGGPMVPFDVAYVGKQAFVAADLTRFNYEAITKLLADPTFDSESIEDALTDGPDDIGTLLDTENLGMELYMVFPYQSVPAYSAMYKGLHFLNAYPPKVIFNRNGTQPQKIHMSCHCIRRFDVDSKSFRLADDDIGEAEGLI